MNDKEFLGLNGFLWFNGVVEDRMDPLYLGRVRVRCLGFHTDDKVKLPTASLPWAQCVYAVSSPGISGLGHSPSFLVEGSWVFGYFRDGEDCQEPVVLGSLPGDVSELANTNKGFYDPNGIYPKAIESDTNRLAINLTAHTSLTTRTADRITSIPTADFDITVAADNSIIDGSSGDTWSQPAIPYNASYPYNHVYESESGHIREYDDTPGAERIHERHKSGTSYEIDKDGNKTDIIRGIHYILSSSSNKHYIAGNSDITIDGRHKIYINKNNTLNNHYDIQVGAGANVNIQVDGGDINLHTLGDGKINVNAGGDYNLKVGGDMRVEVEGSYREDINSTFVSNTLSTVNIRGATIDLN